MMRFFDSVCGCRLLVCFTCYFVCALTCEVKAQDNLLPHKTILKQSDQNPDSLTMYYSLLSKQYRQVDNDSAKKYDELSIKYADMAADVGIKGKAYYNSGRYNLLQTKTAMALKRLRVAEKCFKTKNDMKYLGRTYDAIGLVHSSNLNTTRSIEYYLQALKCFAMINEPLESFATRSNLIADYINIKEYEKARQQCFLMLANDQIKKDTVRYSILLANLGNTYVNTEPKKAKIYLHRALANIKLYSLNHTKYRSIEMGLISLLLTSAYLSEYEQSKDTAAYQNARKQAIVSKEICEENDIVFYLNSCYDLLSKLYLIGAEYDSCIYMAHKSRAHLENAGIKINSEDWYRNIYLAFEGKKRFDSAYYYASKILSMKDTLDTDAIKKKMLNEEMEYELERNELLSIAKLAEKDRDIANRNLIIVFTSSIGLLTLLLYGYFEQKRARRKQKEFTKQLIERQEEESKRISKELHDGIGQNLLIVKNGFNGRVPLLDHVIEDLRNITRGMHPVQLEKLGFTKAVESVIEDAKQASNILFTYEFENIDEWLNPNRAINLYRIVQECISNILKHSKTTAAKIAIKRKGDNIILLVYDKGVGFNLKEATEKKTLGLTSLKERVELLSGTLLIKSNEKGTRIKIEISNA